MLTTNSADQTGCAAIEIQQRQHRDQCCNARQNEVIEDRDAEDFQRVDFLISLHGGDLGGKGTAGSAGHDDRCHDRCQLPHQGNTDQIGDVDLGAELTEFLSANERQDGPDKAVDNGDDDERAWPDFAH